MLPGDPGTRTFRAAPTISNQSGSSSIISQKILQTTHEVLAKAMLNDNFQYSIGPPDSGFSLFLAERTKKIHFIR